MAEEAQATTKVVQSGGPNLVLIIAFVFIAAFGGVLLAFQMVPKMITVNQTIEEHRDPNPSDNLPVYQFF